MDELIQVDWNEIQTLVRWHGYACIVPEVVACTQSVGFGSGCYQALRCAVGVQLAQHILDSEEHEGRQSEWQSHALRDKDGNPLYLQMSASLNADDEPLAYYFR